MNYFFVCVTEVLNSDTNTRTQTLVSEYTEKKAMSLKMNKEGGFGDMKVKVGIIMTQLYCSSSPQFF